MKRKNQIKNTAPYVLMVIPALAVFIIFFIIPLIFTAKYSFYNWTNYSPEITFSGLANYEKLLSDRTLTRGITNTLTYAIVNVLLQSVVALPVAVALNSKLKGRNFYRAVYFCPAVLSTLVVGYLWKYLLSTSDYGFLNQIITGFGFEKVNFLGNGKIALGAIILIEVWQWLFILEIFRASVRICTKRHLLTAQMDGINSGILQFRDLLLL